MIEASPKYKKLRGRAAGFMGITQLWVADDHLMSVVSIFGFEQYRRYFFRNIEALIAVRTSRRLVWNIILVVVIAAIAAAGFAISTTLQTEESRVTCAIVTACIATPFLIALLVNSLLGPTCSFWVQTTGGLESLGAPVRLKAARKITDTVAPEIARAQMDSWPEKP